MVDTKTVRYNYYYKIGYEFFYILILTTTAE